MFSMDDDFTDAKILREVLQDQQSHHNQQHNHHHHHHHQSTSEMMPSNQHRYSYPHSNHQPPLTSTGFHFDSMSSYSMMAADSGASKSSIYMSPDTLAQIRTQSLGMGRSSFRDAAAVSPSSSSYVSSAADSPLGTSSSVSGTSSLIKKPASRICRVHGCTKGIRSRGLCKGHGGGRRCQTPGCEISDQGGGHCIAHGGGKRCNVLGCQKSAQSKGLCKLHGGARRCKVANCAKNCQIKGLCRLHYSMYANASSTDSVI
uniref:WRKY19-like zinc finger domain-containing protein n=1 Tax=Globisporangium ultimum (strain ATCC 200006 / CBS 805.95 / DAOM BR144) TaxID=431595 RepID=K3WR40_GLOUD